MIVGVLLAAGGARRFGSQKLVALLRGIPVVRHAAEVLAKSTDEMIVVVGHEGDAVKRALDGVRATVIENDDWRAGLSSSLRCGIEHLPARAEAAIVALGDQPGIEVDVYRRAIDMYRETRRPIVAARYQGVRGHPVLFGRSVFAELAATAGDAGAKHVIERAAERVAYLDVDSPMPRDVDSPNDLEVLDAPSPPRYPGDIVVPHHPTEPGDD